MIALVDKVVSVIWLSAIVIAGVVPQQIPFSVIVAPPLLVIVPEAVAVNEVIKDAVPVTTTGATAVADVENVESAPYYVPSELVA